MRDDIHKSAPVNRAWRKVIQCCTREADRKERAVERAREALIGDCARELSPERMRELIDRCNSPKTDLFRGNLDGVRSAEDRGGVIGQQLVEQLQNQARIQGGAVNLDGLRDQLASVIEERKESVGRAMRGHVLKAGGKSSAECNEAIRNSLNQISGKDCADQIIANGGKVIVPKRAKMSVSMDENLLG